MKLLKICIPTISKDGIRLTNLDFIDYLQKMGHTITQTYSKDTDLVFNMSAFEYRQAELIKMAYPNAKIINYVWDFYKWAYEGKHGWLGWKEYSEFLKKSDLVIVPSNAQKLRLKELLGIDAIVVKTGHSVFEMPIQKGFFVLDHMRWYSEENEKWIVDACDELGIGKIHTEHKATREEFNKLVASCKFVACGYREASTGGLTILEALWLGKPVLLSNSPYQGGKDYAGDFATYFQYDDYDDCKKKLKEMWDNPPKIDIKAARKYITENFTYELMAKNLEREFLKVCSN